MMKGLKMKTMMMGLMAALTVSAATPALAKPVAEWVDQTTGHRVLRLTDTPGSASLYFHQNSYTPQGDKMVISTPTAFRC